MKPTHLLIGCGGRKLDRPAAACELYTGPLFRAARAYAEASGIPWAVLSARHGLVMPSTVIEPYDCRLSQRGGAPSSAYISRSRLAAQLQRWMGGGGRELVVELHAGELYGWWVRAALGEAYLRPVRTLEPLAGLQVGQRLGWYRAERELRGL